MSDQYDSSSEEDPFEDASQESQISFDEDEDDDESFETSLSDQSEYDSDSGSDTGEPRPKRPKREIPKKSHKNYEWNNKSSSPSKVLSQTTSSTVKVKEEHVSLDPLTIFQKYFDDPFIQLIVKLTNDNASRKGKTLGLTEEELKAYFGMLIIMSFHKLPYLNSYWRRDQNLHVSRISKLMQFRRFSDIGSHICFSTEATVHKKGEQQETDFGLVKPLLDHLNEKFCQIRHSSPALSIDESIVRPKNWINQFRQSGEKHFSVLAIGCSKTGYIFRVNVRGPGKHFRSDCDNRVRDLTLPFEGLGYTIYVARKHASFPLIEELYETQIFPCCELEQNDPNIPSAMKTKPLKIETGHFVQCGDFSITKWKDSQKRYVYVLSTSHDPSGKVHKKSNPSGEVENQSTSRLSSEEGRQTSDPKAVNMRKNALKYPQVLYDYYNLKQGVRIFDNRRLAYSTSWKCYTWTKRLFYYMLDVTLVNSQLVYESSWDSMKHRDSEKPLSCVEFRSELANSLIGGFVGREQDNRELQVRHELQLLKKQNSKMSRGIHSTAKNSTRLQNVGRHLPIKNAAQHRRCANCSMRGRGKRSTVSCKECRVGLCIPCFVPFHTP